MPGPLLLVLVWLVCLVPLGRHPAAGMLLQGVLQQLLVLELRWQRAEH